MNFKQFVQQVLKETTVIGGEGSCMGPGVAKTSSAFSGDNWNTGDSRIAKSIYGKIITRKKRNKKKPNKK